MVISIHFSCKDLVHHPIIQLKQPFINELFQVPGYKYSYSWYQDMVCLPTFA